MHGLFIDLQNYQSVGMPHLDLYCQKFNSDIGGIFLRHQGQSDERESFSLVFMPQRLEVSIATIDDNEECFPAMVCQLSVPSKMSYIIFSVEVDS